jgi:hypothetical protein
VTEEARVLLSRLGQWRVGAWWLAALIPHVVTLALFGLYVLWGAQVAIAGLTAKIGPAIGIRLAADLEYEAARAGWDGFFLGEAIWHNDAWVALTAAAMRTEHIRLGTMLSQMPEIWDTAVPNRGRFLVPALIGLGMGIVFIIADVIFSPINRTAAWCIHRSSRRSSLRSRRAVVVLLRSPPYKRVPYALI